MKTFKFFALLSFVSLMILASCKKEENASCTDGVQNQGETGIDCGGPCGACKEGAHGKWKSFPVAPILATFADSIIAEFNTNNTYTVAQWKGGVATSLTGTFVQTKSSVGSIYTITLNQTTPTTITAKGMLEVAADGKTMKYEVVQTEPSIGAGEPTPAAGFGSSTFNGNPLGAVNIQNYVRLN